MLPDIRRSHPAASHQNRPWSKSLSSLIAGEKAKTELEGALFVSSIANLKATRLLAFDDDLAVQPA